MKITSGNHYLAFVLDESSRMAIIDAHPPRHQVTVCHHVTIQYNITEETVERLQTLVDSSPKFTAVNLLESELIDLFIILVDGSWIETDQSRTHLTFSRTNSAKNRYSNLVIKDEIKSTGIQYINNIELTGRFELIKK